MKRNSYANATSVKSRRVVRAGLPPNATEPSSPTKPRRARDFAPEAKKPVTITTSVVAAPQTPPSSRRAARTEMLKSRFVGTISKAQKQLFGVGDRKEMIVPIPTTTKKPTTEELRELARKALEEMERTVEFDDSHKSERDMQRLCGWPIPSYVGGFQNGIVL